MIREAAVLLSAACLAAAFGAKSTEAAALLPITLSGTVGDEGGAPLAGVAVRAYRGTRVAGSAVSDPTGTYEIEFGIDADSDETVVVWWVAPRTDLVSEVAIVRESARDRGLGIWGPCIPRIGALREQTRSIRLLDPPGLRRRLAEEGCAR